MTNEEAAKLVVSLESCQEEIAIKLEEAKEVCVEEKNYLQKKADLDTEYAGKTLEIELASYKKKEEILEKELDRAMKPKPLSDPKAAFAIGFATACVTVTLVAVGMHEVANP